MPYYRVNDPALSENMSLGGDNFRINSLSICEEEHNLRDSAKCRRPWTAEKAGNRSPIRRIKMRAYSQNNIAIFKRRLRHSRKKRFCYRKKLTA